MSVVGLLGAADAANGVSHVRIAKGETIRWLKRALGALHVILPATILVVWGGVYVWQCFLALTSAGVPIEYIHNTPGGPLLLRADSYHFDVPSNVLRLDSVTVKQPDGRVLASAQSLTVTDLIPGRRPIHAQGRHVFARLERKPNGALRLLDFIAKTPPSESKQAYSADLQHVSILYEDHATSNVWKRWISSDVVLVDGVGSTWASSGELRIQDSGSIRVAASGNAADGVRANVQTAGLEAAALFSHFKESPEARELPELQKLAIDQMRVAGRGLIVIEPDSPVAWSAQLSGAGRGVSYGQEGRAEDARVIAALAPDGATFQTTLYGAGTDATYQGVIRWRDGVTLGGNLVASVDRREHMPSFLRSALGRATDVRGGHFEGWLGYDANGVRAVGASTAGEVRYEDQIARNVAARVDVDGKQLIATDIQGVWSGSPVSGAVAYHFDQGSMNGHLSAERASLGPTLKRYGIDAIEGTARVSVLIDGRASDPRFVVRAEGHGVSRQLNPPVDLGKFELGGTYANRAFDVNRFTLLGPAGSATANGLWDGKRDRVDLDVLATGVSLHAFFAEIAGSAAFSGKVVGTSKHLQGIGQVEVFDAEAGGQDLPFARAEVVVDRDKLSATRVLAFKKGAQATGEGGITFKDKSLNGLFTVNGIDLSDYPPEAMTGIARVTHGTLGGTLDNPVLEADVEAENVAARGVAFEQVSAKTRMQRGVLTVREARALAGKGSIQASGVIDMQAKSGSFAMTGDSLPLGLLLSHVLQDVSVEGLLNGSMSGKFGEGQLTDASFDGELQNFKVNGALLGSGTITAQGGKDRWNGTLFLGTLDSYVQVPSLTYDRAAGKLDGDIVADNFNADILYDSVKRYLDDPEGKPRLSESLLAQLDTFRGQIDFDGHLSGSLDAPDVDVQALTVDGMSIGGQDAGKLTAKGSRHNAVWNFEKFEWGGGPALVRLNKGTLDEHGAIALDGEIKNLRPKWLSAFFPQLSNFEGRGDIPFIVSGKTESPEIQASLSYEDGALRTLITPWRGASVWIKDASRPTRRVDIENLLIKEGSIAAQGVFNVEGFTGTLEANLPFKYPFEIPDDQPWTAVANVPDRPLSSLAELLPGLDIGRTDGSVSAVLKLGGTRSDPLVTGTLSTQAKSVAFNNLVTRFNEVSLVAQFENEKVSLSASGKGSAEGTFATDGVGFKLANLDEAFHDSLAALLTNQLYGNFRVDGLKLDYADKQAGPMTATVSGALNLGGTLEKPEIGGELLLSNANVTTPPAYETSDKPFDLPIDPHFNVRFSTLNNMVLRVPTGRFELSGAGSLGGALSAPSLTSTLVVEKGSVRLPNARVTIEQGGTVAITYRAGVTGATVARADVDLVGRTQVSAESFTGIVERYDVTLGIRGDLLTDNGLQLTASADPPDLSQDRIMAILGQRDVLVGMNGGGFRADRQLQSALLGLAVPYFAGSLTEDLARQLGLDYVNLEYNTFDQFSVTAAISLGKHFILSGRRQISSPLPGERPKYDIRLSYRPPFRSKELRRFTFSVGVDQDRPWKLSVEYGIRF